MSSVVKQPRRSSRRSSAQVSTKSRPDPTSDNDEDDIFQSSGSDFEAEMVAKKKKKKIAPSSSSSDNDDDGEVQEDHGRKLQKGKSGGKKRVVSRKSINDLKRKQALEGPSKSTRKRPPAPQTRKIQRDLNANNNVDDAGEGTSQAPPTFSASAVTLKSVNLSESSSDESENTAAVVAISAKRKLHSPVKLHSRCRQRRKVSKKEGDDEKSDFASQLHALAASYSQSSNSEPWTQVQSTSAAAATNLQQELHSPSKYAKEVAEALAMGETENLSDEEDDNEEGHPTEETVVNELPTHSGNIEVTVALPQKKKSKKEFDVEAYVRRTIGKAKREMQFVMHQCHIVLLVAHLRYLNQQLCQQILLGVALSVVPEAHTAKTQTGLFQLVTWFRRAFKLAEDKAQQDLFPSPLAPYLIERFEVYTANSREDLTIMLLLVLRALGCKARLVLNFVTVPLKPGKEDEEGADKSEYFDEKNKSKSENKISGEKSKNVSKTVAKAKPVRGGKKTSSRSNKPAETSSSDDSDQDEDPTDKAQVKRSAPISANRRRRGKQPVNNKANSDDKGLKKGPPLSKGKTKMEETKSSSKSKSSKKTRQSSTDEDEEYHPDEDRKSKGKVATKKKESKLNLSKVALKEVEARKSSSNSSAAKRVKRRLGSSSGDEFNSMVEPKKKKNKGESSKNANKPLEAKTNYWIEVLVKNEWIAVDVFKSQISCSAEMEERASKPMLYVLACNEDGTLKDVTRRYAKDYLTRARKQRVDQGWVESTLSSFATKDAAMDNAEDRSLEKLVEATPMPKTVQGFKGHPLYALQRHLLKFEGIYPADAPTLGFLRGEAIYARECVHTMHCRVTWLKEGRNVKINEEPYKIVKARPKWDRMSGTVTKDLPLELFGRWQTEIYVPPPAKDGKVPRNEYGNVDLFKPWMLPKGTVHIPIQGLNRIAKKLSIDCAAAMMGWDYHSGACHPVFDGFVVCSEFEDTLLDAWNIDVEERKKRAEEKREKRVLENWKKLVRGLVIAHKIKLKYLGKDQ